jgi:23S rRNA pseudouridine2604 synthase
VDKPLTTEFIKQMRQGVDILDTRTKPAKVQQLNKKTFRITLTEGLNRQIRRMCTALGYRVFRLVRVRIMNIDDHNLKPGTWRHLTKQELRTLKERTRHSKKTV